MQVFTCAPSAPTPYLLVMLHDTSPLHFLTQPRQLLSNVKDLNANPLLLSSTCHTPALLLATLSHNHTQLVAFAETTGRSVGREVKQKGNVMRSQCRVTRRKLRSREQNFVETIALIRYILNMSLMASVIHRSNTFRDTLNRDSVTLHRRRHFNSHHTLETFSCLHGRIIKDNVNGGTF